MSLQRAVCQTDFCRARNARLDRKEKGKEAEKRKLCLSLPPSRQSRKPCRVVCQVRGTGLSRGDERLLYGDTTAGERKGAIKLAFSVYLRGPCRWGHASRHRKRLVTETCCVWIADGRRDGGRPTELSTRETRDRQTADHRVGAIQPPLWSFPLRL